MIYTYRRAFCDVDEDDELAELYKKEVEKEINEICDNVLQFLEKDLVPATKGQNNEAEVFYLKMAGDYCRYKSELKDEVDDTAEKGRKFYERASKVACDNLPATDPVRLGVALNESVFYYEILRQNEKACEIAKKAFDLAIADLDTMDQSSFKDSTLIMQLLRDNLTLWAQGMLFLLAQLKSQCVNNYENIKITDVMLIVNCFLYVQIANEADPET